MSSGIPAPLVEITRAGRKGPEGPRPPWLKIRIANNENFADVLGMVNDLSLNTVCQEARCPNIWECWSDRTATFMLMGDICTRYCGFCSVGKGAPGLLDAQEPRHVAEAIRKLGCRHAVITSVNRDDLPDGGGAHFAETIRQVRALNPGTAVEVLIPDFQGKDDALDTVLAARPVRPAMRPSGSAHSRRYPSSAPVCTTLANGMTVLTDTPRTCTTVPG